MTKKEFKTAMLRGQGRCVVAVQQEPERFRDIVLWACQRDIAYDAQSEGTRSWYVHTLASVYPDKDTFIRAAAVALKEYRPNGGWDLLHLVELLMFFAQDGYGAARQAVEDKYRELLTLMHDRTHRPGRVFYELADLEQLGLVLVEDRSSFLRVAGDFGSLYREKPYMQDGDFAWFFDTKGKRYRKTMEHATKKDRNIASFLQRETATQETSTRSEKLEDVQASLRMALHGDTETLERYALAYREQTQPQLRGKLLQAFRICPYPGDPQPLIEDANSACEELRNAAWRALENIRHPAVRDFALCNVQNMTHTPENFALLVTNYMPQDADLLEMLLREKIAAGDWDGIHAAGMDIIRAFDRDSKLPRPKHLLPLLYDYDPCSFCRRSVVMRMAKHRVLTEDILEECLYDSNAELRSYAVKRSAR